MVSAEQVLVERAEHMEQPGAVPSPREERKFQVRGQRSAHHQQAHYPAAKDPLQDSWGCSFPCTQLVEPEVLVVVLLLVAVAAAV